MNFIIVRDLSRVRITLLYVGNTLFVYISACELLSVVIKMVQFVWINTGILSDYF